MESSEGVQGILPIAALIYKYNNISCFHELKGLFWCRWLSLWWIASVFHFIGWVIGNGILWAEIVYCFFKVNLNNIWHTKSDVSGFLGTCDAILFWSGLFLTILSNPSGKWGSLCVLVSESSENRPGWRDIPGYCCLPTSFRSQFWSWVQVREADYKAVIGL